MAPDTRPRSRILTAVIALLVLVGTVPLGLLGYRLTQFNRDRLEVQQKEHQLVLAEAIAREVGELTRGKHMAVEGFARGIETTLVFAAPRDTLAAVRDGGLLNRALAEDPDLVKLVYATEQPLEPGTPRRLEFVQASRAGGSSPDSAADETLVRAIEGVLETGKPSELVTTGERPALVFALPVRRQEEVVAALAALVSLDGLPERLAARGQQLYSVFLTDAAGARLVAASRPDITASILGSELVTAFREGGGTRTMPFRVGPPGNERQMLGAFATVPAQGWGIFVEIDADSAYYAVSRMRRTTLAWSIGSILLALLLGSLFAERLVHPVRELALGAQRLARGEFDSPIGLKSRNELGLLADSFNHMAGEIQSKIRLLEAAARENKELFMASIRMLAEAIDEKDPYTRGHSERVTRFAVATARAYGLSTDDVEKVQVAALLHDVGKIGIDDRILRKPTVLTDEEFEVMKQHPEKGAHIMGAVSQLSDIIPGMRFHHEKVDGTGYPLGLSGDQIPLAAQIISVADTFDAMTTDRPYQRGMDPEFVLGKLRGWIGTRFRADVVDAFEAAFRAGAIEVRGRRRPAVEAPAPLAPAP